MHFICIITHRQRRQNGFSEFSKSKVHNARLGFEKNQRDKIEKSFNPNCSEPFELVRAHAYHHDKINNVLKYECK